MKAIRKITKNTYGYVTEAYRNLAEDLGNDWSIDLNAKADRYGRLPLIHSEHGDFGVEFFAEGNDIFAVPGFAMDEGWSNTSLNGQSYSVINGQPVLI